MSPTDHERWNDEMARRYDPDSFITKSGFLIRWVEKRRLALTKKLLSCSGKDRVLDVGCGPGNLLHILAAKEAVGIDLSPTLLGQAEKRLAGRTDVRLIKGNVEDLPFEDSSFDALVCSEVLEHVENPDRVLREMARVAKNGARIVITVPNEGLINLTKRFALFLRLKKWLAGGYTMSDNMLDEWHRNELEPARILKSLPATMRLKKRRGVPWPGLAYHQIFVCGVRK